MINYNVQLYWCLSAYHHHTMFTFVCLQAPCGQICLYYIYLYLLIQDLQTMELAGAPVTPVKPRTLPHHSFWKARAERKESRGLQPPWLPSGMITYEVMQGRGAAGVAPPQACVAAVVSVSSWKLVSPPCHWILQQPFSCLIQLSRETSIENISD